MNVCFQVVVTVRKKKNRQIASMLGYCGDSQLWNIKL